MAWVTMGLKLIPLIMGAVTGVERLVTSLHGKDKQDAAVGLVGDMLQALEGIAGKDLLNDAAVQAAVRSAIDAIVAVQNTIAAVEHARLTAPPV